VVRHLPLAAAGGGRPLVVLIWLAAVLRLRGLFANTFHADEALFATWARLIAVWRDPLLMTQPVDKPPLLFYSQALFYPLFGPVEWAARLPSLVASLLLVPLTAQLAWRLSADRRAGLIAALVVAVAPLSVQFSATAFSDPLLTFWVVTALVFVLGAPDGQRALLAGLTFALALATKYQAALFLPLVIGLGWLRDWGRREWVRALSGATPIIVIVGLWLGGRGGGAAVVAGQWANLGGVRLAWSWELGPRLAAQALVWRLGLGGPLLALAGAVLAGVLLLEPARKRLAPAEALAALFVLGWSLLHWLWSVPVWDRYLLPVLPLVAVLLGRGVSLLGARAAERGRGARGVVAFGLLLVAALCLPVAAGARAGRYPIGGQPAADGGVALAARALADAPYGTVLYDHWYSWQWRYQLFDWRVYVSWFPHADALLDDLAAFGGHGPARYLALPASTAAEPIVRRLREAGYGLELVARPPNSSIDLWRISKETAGYAGVTD